MALTVADGCVCDGMSLYALHEAGTLLRNPVYRRGNRILAEEPVCRWKLAREDRRIACNRTLRGDFRFAIISGFRLLARVGRR